MSSDGVNKLDLIRTRQLDLQSQQETAPATSSAQPTDSLPGLLSAPKNSPGESAQTHTIAYGENLSKIAKKYNTTVEALLKANPQIKDANRVNAGTVLNIPKITPTANTNATPAATKTGVTTQKSFEDSQSAEVKAIKASVIDSEGKKPAPYFAPEGKLTIGIGHQMTQENKPQFLKDIETTLKPITEEQQKEYDKITNNTSLSEADKKKQRAALDKKREYTPAEKEKKLKEALKKPENAEALKLAIKKELDAAVKNTGIKDVATTVANNRKLTEAQMQLLLNSDIKNAETGAKNAIGETAYNKATSEQRQVAIDLQYNTGSIKKKAPKFVEHFQAGKMEDAQAELDVFKANGKVQLGLIRRNYQRMLLMNANKTISDKAKTKLLNAYNADRKNKGKAEVKTFEEALPEIQNA